MTKEDIILRLKFARSSFLAGDIDLNTMLSDIEKIIVDTETGRRTFRDKITASKIRSVERRVTRLQREENRQNRATNRQMFYGRPNMTEDENTLD